MRTQHLVVLLAAAAALALVASPATAASRSDAGADRAAGAATTAAAAPRIVRKECKATSPGFLDTREASVSGFSLPTSTWTSN